MFDLLAQRAPQRAEESGEWNPLTRFWEMERPQAKPLGKKKGKGVLREGHPDLHREWIALNAIYSAGLQEAMSPKAARKTRRQGGMPKAAFIEQFKEYRVPASIQQAIERCRSPAAKKLAIAGMGPCEGRTYCVNVEDALGFGLDPMVLKDLAPEFRRFGRMSLTGRISFGNSLAMVKATERKVKVKGSSTCVASKWAGTVQPGKRHSRRKQLPTAV